MRSSRRILASICTAALLAVCSACTSDGNRSASSTGAGPSTTAAPATSSGGGFSTLPATSPTSSAGSTSAGQPPGSGSVDPAKTAAIMQIVRQYMDQAHLKAVILRVSVDGHDLVRTALGESMTGVPATVYMHFRNGAVAISYMSTLLLELVDEKKMSLDDKISKYLPDLPHADEITVKELAQMTSGYQDYVIGNTEFEKIAMADVYKAWTTQEQLDLAVNKPLWYRPGTNWDYAHTNYVILGLILAKVTGMPLEQALQEKVLDPLGLTGTKASLTAQIPEPVLHAFSSERRGYFNIPPICRSTRNRPFGILRGPSPRAPSRRATSTTCTTAPSPSEPANYCLPSRTRR